MQAGDILTDREAGEIEALEAKNAAMTLQIAELNAQLKAVPMLPDAKPVAAEQLVRYCPGCGSVGPVEDKFRDCCPDGIEARLIPKSLAHKCRDTFKLAIGNICAPQPAAAPEPVKLTDEECFKAFTRATGKRLPNTGNSRAELLTISREIEDAIHAKASQPKS